MNEPKTGINPDKKKQYLEWVTREIDFYGRYHNHKETMSWTAIAFYIPGIITLAYGATKMGILTCCWQYLVAFLIIIAFATLVYFFVSMQFRNRWIAHYTIVGLMRIASELICCKQPVGEANYKFDDGKHWPKFIEDEIERAQKADDIKRDRQETQYTSIAAIILATVIALVLICALTGSSPS
jgi:small-conductance mechanosensitive channel